MKQNTNESGITLISLTVLLIVIVILAGISTSTFIGGNGLVTKTTQAADEHEIENEREIITNNVLEAQLDKEKQLGEPLQVKSENDVIMQGETIYGEGWNYIQAGTILQEGVKAEFNWVTNYTTGDVVYLGEGTFERKSE